jgi:hypothetical protein
MILVFPPEFQSTFSSRCISVIEVYDEGTDEFLGLFSGCFDANGHLNYQVSRHHIFSIVKISPVYDASCFFSVDVVCQQQQREIWFVMTIVAQLESMTGVQVSGDASIVTILSFDLTEKNSASDLESLSYIISSCTNWLCEDQKEKRSRSELLVSASVFSFLLADSLSKFLNVVTRAFPAFVLDAEGVVLTKSIFHLIDGLCEASSYCLSVCLNYFEEIFLLVPFLPSAPYVLQSQRFGFDFFSLYFFDRLPSDVLLNKISTCGDVHDVLLRAIQLSPTSTAYILTRFVSLPVN